MSLINEKELGESIANNVGPKLVDAQARFENWADGLVNRLVNGYAARIQVPLGDRTVTITVELVPKP